MYLVELLQVDVLNQLVILVHVGNDIFAHCKKVLFTLFILNYFFLSLKQVSHLLICLPQILIQILFLRLTERPRVQIRAILKLDFLAIRTLLFSDSDC